MYKCGIIEESPIFTVHLLTRLDNKCYIFIGKVPQEYV
jgi:hypothetical protein